MTASEPTPEAEPDLAELPGLADIQAAAERLRPFAVRTPLLESPALNQRLGLRLLVKAEVLQRTGSFKFRGAYNRIAQLSPAQRRRGVVAFSSGNHAQGVAHAAALCGTPAVIVMPSDAPAIKIANTRGFGAEVVLYDRAREDREEIGRRLAAERQAVLVPPFDDPAIIAGQGTVGLEIAEQCRTMDFRPDMVLIQASGGGLIAGSSIALKAAFPDVAIIACEPAGFDDLGRSLASGRRQRNPPGGYSFCDALLAPTPGRLTFAIARRTLAGGIDVDDAEVGQAMLAAFLELKLVLEPGGAVALAAALSGRLPALPTGQPPRSLVVVASGGNADPALFAAVLGRPVVAD